MNKRFLLVLAAGLVFALPALASSNLGTLQENIAVSKVLSVGLNPSSTGNWYLGTNSNIAVATAAIKSNALLITGNSVGSAVISACTDTQGTNCMQVTVNVSAPGQVLGASTVSPHSVGSWVIQGKTVFYVDTNGLVPITTWQIFLSNGGKQALIQPANSGDLALPLEAVMTPNDPRVKLWVIQGQTVYYVDVNGLIPITTWQIFLSNGGQQSLIRPANSTDLALPLEAVMTPNDPRVQN